jgi:predicted protein tyrosine phosphatase
VERLRDWTSSMQDRLAHALAGGRLGTRPRGHAHISDLVVTDFGEACARAGGFDAVISIESPGSTKLTGRLHRFRAATEPAHKVLRFFDIEDPRQPSAPARHHVRAGLLFARQHAGRHMLIHCHAGVSRSTALAYAILIDRHDAVGDERAMLERILEIRPQACPNRLVVRHADALLGCAGRMIQAVEDHPVIQETRRRNFAPPGA